MLGSRIFDDADASVRRLLDESLRGGDLHEVAAFRTNWATSRVLLSAMWSAGPRSLDDINRAEPYSREELLAAVDTRSTAADQVPMIFGSKRLPSTARDLAGNRLLVVDSEGIAHGLYQRRLEELARQALGGDIRATRVLDSHLIDDQSASLLAAGETEQFVLRRQDRLSQLRTDFLRTHAERDFEDTGTLASYDFDDEASLGDDLVDDCERDDDPDLPPALFVDWPS